MARNLNKSNVIFKGCKLNPQEFKEAVRKNFNTLARLAGNEAIKDVVKKILQEACKKRARELQEHFDLWGWDVRSDGEQMILDEFGVDLSLEVLMQLQNVVFTIKPDNLLGGKHICYALKDDGAERFAVYDSKENVIKTYRFDQKFPRDGGRYEWLGRL